MGAEAVTVLNSNGQVIKTIAGGDINGPWDMTAVDGGNQAVLFVTNVLNGTVRAKGKDGRRGTVVRMKLSLPEASSAVVRLSLRGSGPIRVVGIPALASAIAAVQPAGPAPTTATSVARVALAILLWS